jgi:hypothetical protein
MVCWEDRAGEEFVEGKVLPDGLVLEKYQILDCCNQTEESG